MLNISISGDSVDEVGGKILLEKYRSNVIMSNE